MKEYKKNWRPFAAWTVALVPVMLGAANLAERAGLDSRGMVAVMMAVVTLMLLILMWMLWKGEHVYWLSGGPSFEDAKQAGSEVRREYARRHFAAMLKGSGAALVLLAAGYALGAHEIVMMLSTAVCIVASAISTVRIKWTVNSDDLKN